MALDTVYVIMGCFAAESEDDRLRFDVFLILLIFSESAFKAAFSALMTFQLFHAFRGHQHALSDTTRFILLLCIGIELCIEILYDAILSFTDSDALEWNRMLPAIYLLVDLGIALTLILMFLQKLTLSIKEENVLHLQSTSGSKADTDTDSIVNLQSTKSRRRIVFCCITAVVVRSIYLSVVIAEEIMSDKEEFDVIYSVRIWITMIGVGIQSLCVFLLFPFAEKEYQCLC
ncbi:MAG: hypothetical protein GY766_27215, partial [Herbaspirillum sp.]|uniref:hypothetical protein n=1 Tax=Herbaspirillum sp. TaxID=1890675 RepID=UPI00258AFC68